MNSLFDKLKISPQTQYKLGELSKAFSPWNDLTEKVMARRKEQEESRKQSEINDQLAPFFESKGIPRAILQNPEYTKIALKELLKPPASKSFGEQLLDEIFTSRKNRNQGLGFQQGGMKQGMPQIIRNKQGNIQAIIIDDQVIPADQIPPETLKQLEIAEAQAQSQNEQEPTTWGQSLGQFGTGVGAGLLSKALGFLPDIASLPLAAQNLGANPTDVKNWEYEMLERNPNQQGIENLNPQEAIEAYNQMRPLSALEKALPTTQNILNTYIPAATKGTALEPYTIPKKGEETAQKIGSVTGLFAKPGGGLINTAKDLFKSAGIALSGHAVGATTKAATGSERAGEAAEGLFYLGASMFPGSARHLGEERYEKFGQEIVDKAKAEGKTINPNKGLANKILDFEAEVVKDFPHATDDVRKLQNEITKLKNVSGIKGVAAKSSKEVKELTDLIGATEKAIEKFPNVQYLKDNLQKYESELHNITGGNAIDPGRLWDRIKDLKKVVNSSDHSIRPYMERLNDIQKEALNTFADSVIPGGSQILSEANGLWTTAHKIEQDTDFFKNKANAKFGLGMLPWLAGGGYKVLVAQAGLQSAKAYLKHMAENPAIQKLTAQLANAASRQNIALVKNISDRLNKKAETIVDQLPEKDQMNIRKALAEMKKKYHK